MSYRTLKQRQTDAALVATLATKLTVTDGAFGITGRATVNNLRVGPTTTGTPITLIVSATAVLDFASIAGDGVYEDKTITVTGAAVGAAVELGLPIAPTAGIIFSAFVSATNTVSVRATNITPAAIDPVSATYRVTVFNF
jgi:hypothetical protein